MSRLYDDIYAALTAIPAIDTHQHMRFGHNSDDDLVSQAWNFESVFVNGSYSRYLHAGLRSLRPSPATYLEKLRWLRTTSTFRSMVVIPLRDLYDCDAYSLDAAAIERVHGLLRKNYQHGPHIWCQQVMERANIARGLKLNLTLKYFDIVLPGLAERDRAIELALFAPIWWVDAFIAADPWSDHQALAERFGVSLSTLDGYLSLLDALFAHAKRQSVVAIKSILAYQRTLHVEPVSLEEGRELYARRACGNKRLHDFLWRCVAQQAAKHDLPFLIHTGIIPGNLPTQGCNPSLLHDLITHPDCAETRFVLMHTGYPFSRELVMMSWNSPNVFVDFVWLPLVGFETAVQVLAEFLDWAPLHKFTIGTDCHQPETTYGAMVQSREVLARVLARKCELGLWTEQTALEAGKAILHDNARMLYALP